MGFNVGFFPMHLLGLWGMPRRVYTHPSGLGWDTGDLIASLGALTLAAGVLVFLANVVVSLRNGHPASANPWDAPTLEWATASPPHSFKFRHIPVVTGWAGIAAGPAVWFLGQQVTYALAPRACAGHRWPIFVAGIGMWMALPFLLAIAGQTMAALIFTGCKR